MYTIVTLITEYTMLHVTMWALLSFLKYGLRVMGYRFKMLKSDQKTHDELAISMEYHIQNSKLKLSSREGAKKPTSGYCGAPI